VLANPPEDADIGPELLRDVGAYLAGLAAGYVIYISGAAQNAAETLDFEIALADALAAL
jgi:hypothetical protein